MIENTFGKNIIPYNDSERLTALKRYRIMDTPSEESFDNIAKLAVEIFNVPISLVSLVDADRVFFKANVGMGKAKEANRGKSLCALAVLDDNVTVFENALKEPCLIANPNVAGDFGLRFYAGAPLVTHDGFLIGTLCIIDKQLRTFSKKEESILKKLAIAIMDQVELRLSSLTEVDKYHSINEELAAQQEEMTSVNEELIAANEELSSSQEYLMEANDALFKSEGRFRLIADNISQFAWMADAQGSIFWYNKRWYDFTGTSLEQMQGWGWQTAHHPNHVDRVTEKLKEHFESGEPWEDTFPLRSKDGEYRWFLSRAVPSLDAAGNIISWFGTNTDITEDLAARNELAVSEDRFRTMAEGTDIMITVGDENSNSIFFNKAWTNLTGREIKDLLEVGWVDLVHPEDRELYVNSYLDAFKNKTTFTGEFRILNSEGDYRWLLARGAPRINTDGTFAGHISSCIDITERKKDDRRKGDFIGMVSHELKTPLTSLTGYIQILRARAGKNDDAFAADALDKANNQVSKMKTLITGFLDVSRYESGKIAINKQPFNLAELVKETEEECIATISSHEVIFAPVQFTMVNADRDKIGQVINNLISNAVKYSPPRSNIHIECITVDNMTRVSVKDEGMGISKKDQEKLFERYYRVEGEQMNSISGFGIGLYLCYEIIQRHNGQIWVESDAGKGSTFWFTIPLL